MRTLSLLLSFSAIVFAQKARRHPSKLVVFPDEGHWILKGENSRVHMQEVLAWLQRYL
jgi:dipeptidyl aminopeptidase/acylaminoacyl peptidase